MQYFVGSDLRR